MLPFAISRLPETSSFTFVAANLTPSNRNTLKSVPSQRTANPALQFNLPKASSIGVKERPLTLENVLGFVSSFESWLPGLVSLQSQLTRQSCSQGAIPRVPILSYQTSIKSTPLLPAFISSTYSASASLLTFCNRPMRQAHYSRRPTS